LFVYLKLILALLRITALVKNTHYFASKAMNN